MTEAQLRASVVAVMQGWLGYSEANGKHKQIIDLYNTQRPLPGGYRMGYTDEWCAATVTAAGMAAGLHDIILGECSCSRMMALYKAAGRWQERDDYCPQPGDIILYDWQDSGAGDNTGAPDHVGMVEQAAGECITVIEGNKGEAVARRKLAVNGRYIRGYCLPDYKSKVEESMTQNEFDAMLEDYLRRQREKKSSDWSAAAWEKAAAAGLFDGTAPQAPLSREQAALVLDRLGLLHGKEEG